MNKRPKPACRRGRVIAAMSGGVDSSIAAALLKRKGCDVVGVFILMHENSNPTDAKRVAIKLNIPFYVLNVQKEFKKRVVDYFINEYKKGNTPNPCVECNRWIKFRFLLEKAMALKADYIATGHYARVKNGKLLAAKDKTKDQSYFLWKLNQRQLNKILFPIGDYTKAEVRAMAKKFGLFVFKKEDSQEICFMNTDLRGFLKNAPACRQAGIQAEKGPLIMTDGKKVGEHEGLAFYTIGQRKGIKIGGIGPFYVVEKDFKNNALIVSNSEKDLFKKEMIVKNINWISGKSYTGKCKIKIRSMTPMFSATIKKNRVIFDKKQRAITPGQSAVFYRKNEVLGGGIINK